MGVGGGVRLCREEGEVGGVGEGKGDRGMGIWVFSLRQQGGGIDDGLMGCLGKEGCASVEEIWKEENCITEGVLVRWMRSVFCCKERSRRAMRD
jgi:hypothetical protein